MKILITIRSYEHIPYVYKLIKTLSKSNDCTLALDETWSSKNISELKKHELLKELKVKYDLMVTSNKLFLKMKKYLFEFITLMSYLRRKETTEFYSKRWMLYQPRMIRYLCRYKIFKRILKSKRLFNLVYKIYLILPIDKSIKDKIKECDYDCMISTAANLRFSNENEYILAAKHLGLKVHYPILTWDNLTTKSLVLNIIDHIYVWNKLQQEYCKKIHHIKSEKIIISGSLFFEKWFSHNDNFNKEKYILYIGSSANIKNNETENILFLYETIKNSNLAEYDLIVRSHPAKLISKDLLPKSILFDDDNVGLTHSEKSELYLSKIILKSYLVFGLNTSAMIDSYALGVKSISIIDASINKTQTNAPHFKQMIDENIIASVKPEDLLDLLNSVENKTIIDRSAIFFKNRRPSEIIESNIVMQ